MSKGQLGTTSVESSTASDVKTIIDFELNKPGRAVFQYRLPPTKHSVKHQVKKLTSNAHGTR